MAAPVVAEIDVELGCGAGAGGVVGVADDGDVSRFAASSNAWRSAADVGAGTAVAVGPVAVAGAGVAAVALAVGFTADGAAVAVAAGGVAVAVGFAAAVALGLAAGFVAVAVAVGAWAEAACGAAALRASERPRAKVVRFSKAVQGVMRLAADVANIGGKSPLSSSAAVMSRGARASGCVRGV